MDYPTNAGTHNDPVRYEHLDRNDPQYKAKLKAQLDKAGRDAKSGKCICISDLFCSAGM